jgi:hypothetical protein
LGVTIFGMISDPLQKRVAKGQEPKPEYRLPPSVVGLLLVAAGLFWYG